MRLATRAALAAFAIALTLLSPAPARSRAAGAEEAALAPRISAFLAGGADRSRLASADPLAPLGRYPLLATTTYLLMQDDPVALKRHYPLLLKDVNALFSTDNMTDGGLVRGMPGASPADRLSPAFNAFANLELWSLHLIAWKIGAYEDALDYLSWSRRFSETVTRSFYSPTRGEFFPIASSGRFAPGGTPAELLPLVLDRTLGSSAARRLLERAAQRYAGAPPGASAANAPGEWRDPAARPVIVDLLSNRLRPGSAIATAIERAARDTSAARPDAWVSFWRSNPSRRDGLVPAWAPIAALANLTLLLDRESLALPAEIGALRAGIDTVDAALGDAPVDIGTHAAAVAAINRLMARLGRFSTYVAGPKERWRVAEEAKWVRISPRVKRLVNEGCAAAIEELASAKALLTDRIERAGALTFSFEIPADPLSAGAPVPFTAVLASREPIDASQVFLHVGESRWNIGAPSGSSVISTRTPLRHEGSVTVPPDAPPGIVPITAHLDFLSGGKRIELWKRESAVVATPHDASMSLPAGRRIEGSPLPIAISIGVRADRDVQGEIEGSFLREIVTEPALPARFLVKGGTNRTSLTLTAGPRARLSPGSYPFSLVVSVGGTEIASFADSLIHPFRWMHLGPFPPTADVLSTGARYQSDLYRRYRADDATEMGWREAPGGAVDVEGALRPERLYDGEGAGCGLFYTMVDSPARSKVRWSLSTADAAALWINGLPVLPAIPAGAGRIDGEAELRQGPNAFLVATRWDRVPSPIRFDIRDENGLPPAGLNNDLSEIIDGWERIVAPPVEEKGTSGAPVRMQPVSFSLDDRSARDVSLIGSFNNWDPAATPMKRDENGLWRASLMLKPGRYSYKFLVDRARKIVDPRNSVSEPDGFGGSSSVIEVK